MRTEGMVQTPASKSIPSHVARRGYRVNSVTFHGQEHPPAALPSGETTVRYTIPTPYGSYRDHVQFATVQLLDLSLFRHVPHGVKASVYNEQAWLLESWHSEGRRARNARPSNHAAFLEEFADRMTIVRDEPVYTFIHVALPHPPYVVNEDCSFIGPQRASRPTYAAQGRCALTVVQKLFDRLRALGVYDRTVGESPLTLRLLRRLLSLDYVLEHPHAPWLPTENEKVSALVATGIPRDVLPGRLYQGAVSAQFRYFPHKLPLALDAARVCC